MKINLGLLTLASCLFTNVAAANANDLADPTIAGSWSYAFLTYADDVVTFVGPNQLHEKSVMGGKLFVDADGTLEIETTTTPKRFIETIVKADPTQVVKMQPGDRFYCIYELSGATLLLECSDINVRAFPTEFKDGYGYSKVTQ